jgi:Xaa-Pro aminopeptidase
MSGRGLGAVLVSQPENRRYLSGFSGSAGYLLITPDRAVLATDFRYTEQAGAQASDHEVYRIGGRMSDWLPGLTAGLDGVKLGFEAGDVTFALHQQIAKVLSKASPGTELTATDGLVESLRAVKDADEAALMAKAAGIADRAIEGVIAEMRPGVTEKEVAWNLERTMREMGSEAMPFEVIVASGPNGAMAHHRPSERRIDPGEPVVIDMGARVGGYCSDLTRTICLGEPDETFRKVYGTVLRAQEAAIDGIGAGMSGQAADGIARAVIEEAGHGDEFGHSLGHGVGLVPHEEPTVGPNSKGILENGMVFSIEPGIYVSGWGGVRIEDLAVMENGRPRLLSGAIKMHPAGGKGKT